jgi:hypothetical protein
MAAQEPMLTSRQKPTDIYSLMLILASVFLLFTTVLIWQELDEFYDFWGTAESTITEEEEAEPTDTGEAGETTDDAAGDATDDATDETTEPPAE